MLKAIDVARCLVQECIGIGKPTTNMKLQKMLYYAWIDYYVERKVPLFEDPIYAWKLGPVVKDVYRAYKIFAGSGITFTDEPEGIDDDTRAFLKSITQKYCDTSAYELVHRSHDPSKPWAQVYRENERNIVIPTNLIITLECQ